MDLYDQQRRHIEALTAWAEKIRERLGPILEAHGDRVHFRPGSKGIAMVGLLPDRPQRGKSGLRDLGRVAEQFETLFAEHCRDVPHGRVTGEKALQSFLISEAHRNGRRLASINAASAKTSDPVELVFVTDEIPLPAAGGKIICDILALRRDGGRSTPVVIELKDSRMRKRLVEQVQSYSVLVDVHAECFEKLYGAVLGEAVSFDNFAESWIVWPAAGSQPDPCEHELAEQGIRIVGYDFVSGSYTFSVGTHRPQCPSCGSTDGVVPIVYGEPGHKLSVWAEQGKVVLGGCVIHEEQRTWCCRRCRKDFGPFFLAGRQ